MVDEEENSTSRSERAKKISAAIETLRALHSYELFNIISNELSCRRLDAEGNPTEEEGLYIATMQGVSALLGMSATDETAFVARLAALGRGARLAQKEAAAMFVRQIRDDLKATWPEGDQADMMATAYTLRYRRPVDPEAVRTALNDPNPIEKVRLLCVAVDIFPKDKHGKIDKKKTHDTVRKALK